MESLKPKESLRKQVIQKQNAVDYEQSRNLYTHAGRQTQNMRIKESDLLDYGYPVEKVIEDLDFVYDRLQKFNRQKAIRQKTVDSYNPNAMNAVLESMSDRATDLEYLVGVFLVESDWLKDFENDMAPDDDSKRSAEVHIASLDDDIGNGTDIILTLNNQLVGRKIVALDTTLVRDVGSLKYEKFKARANLPRGFTNLNYALDEVAIDVHGRVEKVPRFVIGAQVEDENDGLIGLMRLNPKVKLSDTDRLKRNKWEAATALKIVTEIAKQASLLERSLKENSVSSPKYASNIKGLAEYFAQARDEALATYANVGGKESDLQDDPHFVAIMEASDALLQPPEYYTRKMGENGRKAAILALKS
ncbi:MAG: hypothetical protein LBQ02_02785 [Candidatus Nomurabacteria bacterium]|jgi:hypothetical protein|nr:hypothetical protein [Candidatus Nomurabacteria bacterium]